jgi:hypothetical protein
MGLSSAAAGEGPQLCVFDLRRGQQEGQELDKILFFHPTDCPILLQLSVIGLCEGIITFARFAVLLHPLLTRIPLLFVLLLGSSRRLELLAYSVGALLLVEVSCLGTICST